MSGNSGCLGQQVEWHPVTGYLFKVDPTGSAVKKMISSIANTGYARWRPSPSLIRDPKSQAEGPNIIYEVRLTASTAQSERGPSAWAHPLEEEAIDYGVYGARHPQPGRALRSNVPRGWLRLRCRPCDADARCVGPSRCSVRTCPESCWSALAPRSVLPSRPYAGAGHCRTSRCNSDRGTCRTARWRDPYRRTSGTADDAETDAGPQLRLRWSLR